MFARDGLSGKLVLVCSCGGMATEDPRLCDREAGLGEGCPVYPSVHDRSNIVAGELRFPENRSYDDEINTFSSRNRDRSFLAGGYPAERACGTFYQPGERKHFTS